MGKNTEFFLGMSSGGQPFRNCLEPGTRPEGVGTESPAGCEEITRP
jgi:hypothetical protein